MFHPGQHGRAAKAAKIVRFAHYRWLETDEHYRLLHARATVQITEVLEDEAICGAVKGVSKGVYYRG